MKLLSILLMVAVLTGITFAEERPTTRPAARNGWDGAIFRYSRPAAMVVEETTPTPAQVEWRSRPPQLNGNESAPVTTDRPAKPVTASGMAIVRLRFRNLEGQDVPLLLATPSGKKGPFPVVIALHGLTSNKAQVVAQVAPALTKRGFAVLAPDLTLHGERPGEPRLMFDRSNLIEFFNRCQTTIRDVRQVIDLAESRADLDTRPGVVLVGYSMGAIFNSVIGPTDPRVRAMVLMVGGANEFPPAMALIPQVAALQPLMAIPHFAGRPLLMLNGKRDEIITSAMGQRLFNAAAEPKEQVWFDSGHLLPQEAYDQAAEWVAARWKEVTTTN